MSHFLEALEHRRAHTGVHALGRLAHGRWYEAALVHALPAELATQVASLRASMPFSAPADKLLAPHMTVLFVGRWPSAQLERFAAAFASVSSARCEVAFESLGVFERADRIVNVHLAATRSADARALHDRAMEACLAEGWMPQTPFVGDAYTPHVSVLDGIDVAASLRSEILSRPFAPWVGELTELRLIGRLVDAPVVQRAPSGDQP